MSALSGQCLDHQNHKPTTVRPAVEGWCRHPNRCRTRIDWHFTIAGDPISLKCFNPNPWWFGSVRGTGGRGSTGDDAGADPATGVYDPSWWVCFGRLPDRW